MNNKGFTLIEALISVTLTGMILISAYSAFQSVMMVQGKLSNSIVIQKNLFYLGEKITSLIRAGGTLDYEEYFNRKMLGYLQGDVVGEYTYSTISEFGNGGILYKCQEDSSTNEKKCLEDHAVSAPNTNNNSSKKTTLINGQKYGQYAALSLNYGTEGTLGYATPNKLPPIIDTGNPLISNGLPELYLIKKLTDGNFERTYFRHTLISYPTKACNPVTHVDCLGKLQMTKLTSCSNTTTGVIEKWVAHSDFGSENCSTASPTSTLVWIDITPPDIDVISATFLPYPYKIPSLMSGSGEEASAPSIQMRLEMGISKLKPTALSSAGDTRIMMTTIHLND